MLKLELISGGGVIDDAKEVKIEKGANKGELRLVTSMWKPAANCKVLGINWQEDAQGSAGKTIAGAAIGGLLAGPVGLAAGALVGGKKKDKSTAIVTVETESGTSNIYVRCNTKELQQLNKLLK